MDNGRCLSPRSLQYSAPLNVAFVVYRGPFYRPAFGRCLYPVAYTPRYPDLVSTPAGVLDSLRGLAGRASWQPASWHLPRLLHFSLLLVCPGGVVTLIQINSGTFGAINTL